jgi:3-phenylpropionate/cinnamic acid dioxygenase small subunit
MSEPLMLDARVTVEIYQLYARQSHLIDSGEAAGWAETFTRDGSFHSPSYPQPSVGREQLIAFAESFRRSCREGEEVRRHVITNIVVDAVSTDQLRVTAYLHIVGTAADGSARIVRMTVIADEVVRRGETWLVQARRVTPDTTLLER